MQLLESSINTLDAGVSDYPRLGKVLQTTRVYLYCLTLHSHTRLMLCEQHFELVSEHDLTTAQSSLLSEITPEVDTLLSRVETYLDKLERREQALIAKAELQEGRLSQPSRSSSSYGAAKTAQAGPGAASAAAGGGNLSAVEEMKMQNLRQKKERLSYAVSRLELQAGQRERQLRKSMAASEF